MKILNNGHTVLVTILAELLKQLLRKIESISVKIKVAINLGHSYLSHRCQEVAYEGQTLERMHVCVLGMMFHKDH